MNNLTKKMKLLAQTKEGDFIQTKYRDPDDPTPPPIFYRGTDVFELGGGYSVSLLCLHTLRWRTFQVHHDICDIVPKITDEQRLSVIPYLQEEPTIGINRDIHQFENQILGKFPQMAVFNEIADVEDKHYKNIMNQVTYGKMVVCSTPHAIIKVDAV